MMALLTAMMAAWLYALLRERYGRIGAWCGSLALLTLPGILVSDASIMTEIPQAFLMLGAIAALGTYLDRGTAGPALQFGMWSAAALLAKGSAVALAPVPVIGAGLTRHWKLFRSVWFWAPALIVLCVAGPWYRLAPDALHQRVAANGGPGLATWRLQFPPMLWTPQFGWAISLLVCAGIVVTFVRAIRGVALRGWEASATGLVICASVFPFFFAVWENRHQIEAAPAFILLAAAGLSWLGSMLPWRGSRFRAAVLLCGTVATMAWNVAHATVQPEMGYRRLAQAIVRAEGEPIESVLISSDAQGEGALIAELAQLDARPGRFVLRSSKVLAQSSWMGRLHYSFDTRTQLEELLAKVPAQVVVLDRARLGQDSHAELLATTLSASPDVWEEWRSPDFGKQFQVFRRYNNRGRLGLQERNRLEALQRPD
jgi:hypothetical protein